MLEKVCVQFCLSKLNRKLAKYNFLECEYEEISDKILQKFQTCICIQHDHIRE